MKEIDYQAKIRQPNWKGEKIGQYVTGVLKANNDLSIKRETQ